MKTCTFQKKSTAGENTKEGENICPPSKIIAFDEGERILILTWAQAGCADV